MSLINRAPRGSLTQDLYSTKDWCSYPYWTQEMGIIVTQWAEDVAPFYGYHVGLTGGLLYKAGPARKDLDLVFYKIRQGDPDRELLLDALCRELGLKPDRHCGWVEKVTWEGRHIDLLFPDYVATDGSFDDGYPG